MNKISMAVIGILLIGYTLLLAMYNYNCGVVRECIDSERAIPNIVHLVKVDGNYYEFDFFHWLIVKATTETIKPDIIYLHGDVEPYGEWWDRAKKYVQFNEVEVITHTPSGKEIERMEHKSDFVRLQQLIKYGGIYLDLDAVPLRSFDKLRNSGFDHIFGRQANNQIAVGLMVSQKETQFMKNFLAKALERFDGGWTSHSVSLLSELSYTHQYTNDVLILDWNSFFPLSWEQHELDVLLDEGHYEYNWELTYALHMFRSVSAPRLPNDGLTYMMTKHTNFARALKWVVQKAIDDGEVTWPLEQAD